MKSISRSLLSFALVTSSLIALGQTTGVDQAPWPNLANPTAFYNTVTLTGGINFSGGGGIGDLGTNQLFRELRLQTSIVAFENFRLKVSLPASNSNLRQDQGFFDQVEIDLEYGISHGTGFFNRSVIGIGFSSPIVDDFMLPTILSPGLSPYSQELRVNYTGAFELAKIGLYPSVEYYRRITDPSIYAYNTSDSLFVPLHQIKDGIRMGLTISFPISEMTFIQMNTSYEYGKYRFEGTDLPSWMYRGVPTNEFNYSVRFQHGLTKRSHIYTNVGFRFHELETEEVFINQYSSFSMNVGYVYAM
ncbi:hypothetical protein [Phaeocystidibacter luteus]|uniref:Uncharacterized protein n=1 Tax=Phaeocystidibacter luteus TaxID=911197 RepID=A0A6N6RJ04_9FLAO|nr:hypothetical protein [Phaeocystidibacter luteus]KAB2810358.1 hypothetical protein F8C67_07155 [Phaeocystidibacter luteus]